MTHDAHLFAEYTDQILAFALENETPSDQAVQQNGEEERQTAQRALRLLEKSRKEHLLLLGLGTGHLAARLARELPENKRLTVLELSPQRARDVHRSGLLDWRTPDGPAQLVADTSPWALTYLPTQAGLQFGDALMQVNPETTGGENEQWRRLQRTLTLARPHAAINGTPFGHFAVQAPSLSVGCILHPDEPDLDGFLAQFPDWVEELVVIWDAEELPDRPLEAACPVRQFARPLDGDFGAQRNRMLKECSAEWVLYLDADERLGEDHWTLLPGLFPVRGVQAYFFPRLTFYPDGQHCRVGYGLWPDLQARLFRNLPDLRFENPVHERLTGIAGRTGLVLDAPILHASHLLKRPETLRDKLERFDGASGGALRHRLNADFPRLPLERFRLANPLCNEISLLLLPQFPA